MNADLENEVRRLNAIVENQAKALGHWRQKSDQDAGEIARYRAALERHRRGLLNLLEVRRLPGEWGGPLGPTTRYGALTREEIEASITEIETALQPEHSPAGGGHMRTL